MGSLMTGFRQTLRRLLRAPGFTFVVVATLALGIGLTASVFQLLNAVVLRPLPYPSAERLVSIAMVDENGRMGTKVSAADVADWRRRFVYAVRTGCVRRRSQGRRLADSSRPSRAMSPDGGAELVFDQDLAAMKPEPVPAPNWAKEW